MQWAEFQNFQVILIKLSSFALIHCLFVSCSVLFIPLYFSFYFCHSFIIFCRFSMCSLGNFCCIFYYLFLFLCFLVDFSSANLVDYILLISDILFIFNLYFYKKGKVLKSHWVYHIEIFTRVHELGILNVLNKMSVCLFVCPSLEISRAKSVQWILKKFYL